MYIIYNNYGEAVCTMPSEKEANKKAKSINGYWKYIDGYVNFC